jgi:hypothetical protein
VSFQAQREISAETECYQDLTPYALRIRRSPRSSPGGRARKFKGSAVSSVDPLLIFPPYFHPAALVTSQKILLLIVLDFFQRQGAGLSRAETLDHIVVRAGSL